MDKVGVFLCTGCDIGTAVPETDKLLEICTEAGAQRCEAHAQLCAPDAVALVRKAIDAGELNGVLVAACSQRSKGAELGFDPAKAATYRLGLRELVAWTQPPGDENTRMLAEDLLRMGMARVSKMELPARAEESIARGVLVVGGGLTGLCAARAASAMGYQVVLVEKSAALGGHLRGVQDLVPEGPPYDRLHESGLPAIVADVKRAPGVRVLLESTVQSIAGQPGRFEVSVRTPGGGECFEVGAVVQATGAHPYDATRLGHLGYGASPNVVTSQELEAMLAQEKLVRPGNGKRPARVVFIQCAGSRDAAHLPYCSAECCATSLRQATLIRRRFPEVETAIVYRDVRAPGQLDRFYVAMQEQSGAMLSRGEVDKVETGGRSLDVHLKTSLLGDELTIEADLVVLAVGMVPSSADGEAIRQLRDAYGRIEKKESEKQVEDAKKLVEQLRHHDGTEILGLQYRQGPDLPVLRYGFPDSHYICFPYETRRTGIYAAGAVRAPMDPAQAAEDGWGAALKAVQSIEACSRGEAVHPRAGDGAFASFFLQRCTQCKRCTEECPFGALNEDAKGTPEYNVMRCRRCGICLGACPERIVSFPEYSVDAVASMIKAISVPDADEEKPRMVAFVCENDALPALDEAAARRLGYNPWIRVIPVRCLGAVNTVWIADALSSGIDGILLLGCKKGDDYQCHYIRGSELAITRMTNVKETLQRLTLEQERVQIVELGRDEYERIPQVFQEFAATIERVGPNPYKGF
ncbi:MAG: hydrogenase iron-sulfur subunit [Deltaproteobacteria bacterium]|nr:hydrogenase iron-sulfur subunit [Deltaproteobacteria bacterium]